MKKYGAKYVSMPEGYWLGISSVRVLLVTPSVALFAIFCVFSTGVRSAQAETLFEAMVSAYVANPALKAARARLRATDEEVPRARSGFRPTIIGSADTGYQDTNSSPSSSNDEELYPKSLGVSLSQPIFRGFRTINSVRQAEANVRAGRQDLKTVEQSTLLNAVIAYMDLVRDQAIVRLRRNNVRVLREQSEATKDRFDVGEVTKTDVAQSEARAAGAGSQLSLAQSNLETSRAAYRRIVGHRAKKLAGPGKIGHVVPKSLEDALDVGFAENPEVLAAMFRARASRHAVDSVRGELLPEVNLEASYSKNYDSSSLFDEQEATTVTGRLRVPFYQAGEVAARVRQSKQNYYAAQDDVEDVRDRIRSQIVSAWSELKAAKAKARSDQSEVRANRTALVGVREEEQVGQRTILDVLDAEQELLDSEVEFVGTERDVVVASFNVLASIGRLTATDLGLSVEYYDPEEYYNNVRRKWIGTGQRLPRHID